MKKKKKNSIIIKSSDLINEEIKIEKNKQIKIK